MCVSAAPRLSPSLVGRSVTVGKLRTVTQVLEGPLGSVGCPGEDIQERKHVRCCLLGPACGLSP